LSHYRIPLSPSQRKVRHYTRLLITYIARILLLLALVFILDQATKPHPILSPVMLYGDKVLHAVAFFTLTVLTELSFPSLRLLLWKVLFLLGFGLFIEWLQSFLPWRSADASDFLADCIGIAAFLVPMLLVRVAFGAFRE